MFKNNNNYKIVTLISLIMLFFVKNILADELVRFISIGMKEGLANPSISAMVQDKAGFIWIGTQGGLHRWDGKSFALYENEPFNSKSLPHNQIQSLYLDDNGETIWIGTYGGLARLDTRTGEMSSWSHNSSKPDSLCNDIIVSMGQDKEGRLWVGTLDGLDRKEGDSFVHYRTKAGGDSIFASSQIRSILRDSSGILWVGTGGGGLYKYSDKEDGFNSYMPADKITGKGLPSDFVYSIKEDKKGNIWLGLWYFGLVRLDPKNDELLTYPLPDQRVYFINAQDEDYLRIGTWGAGIFELSLKDGSLYHYKQTSDWQWSLPNNTTYSMLVDNNSNIWVGTNGSGFALMLKEGRGYSLYEHDPANPDSRSSGRTYSVLEDTKGRLWIGTYNGGLDRLDPGSRAFKHFRREPNDPYSLPDDIVTKVYEDSKGNIWVLTNDGMARFIEEKNSFEIYRNDPDNSDSIAGNITQNILEEPGTGNFWIATYNNGLEYWDRQNNKFYHYPNKPDDPRSISANLAFALAYDSHGRLWVGTNQGLNRYEGNGIFTRYLTDKNNPKSLPSQNIRAIIKDHADRLWIATDSGGVALYNEQEDNFRYWTKKDGLVSNSVVGLIKDNKQNIWAVSINGIAILDHYAELWRPFLDQSRLRYGEFTRANYLSEDGTLYIGATNALYSIKPESLVEVNKTFPVVLTSIMANNKELDTGMAPWFLSSIKLPWEKNDLSLSFCALDYEDPNSLQYAYKLEGHDKDWIYSGARSFVNYTNLKGGRYVFKLKASIDTGKWIDSERELHIKVEPAPWLSVWAILLYIALGILAVWVISIIRTSFFLKDKVFELSELKTQLEDANLKLEDLAAKDGLTGLQNRRTLNTELVKHFEAAVMLQEPLAALMIDIDFFKAYNDRYGHQAGDECLVAVAKVLNEALERPKDSLTRYGGEEFLALLPGTDLAGAMLLAERMRKAVLEMQIIHDSSSVARFITISVGYASYIPKKDELRTKIINMADEALYKAKNSGRNRISD